MLPLYKHINHHKANLFRDNQFSIYVLKRLHKERWKSFSFAKENKSIRLIKISYYFKKRHLENRRLFLSLAGFRDSSLLFYLKKSGFSRTWKESKFLIQTKRVFVNDRLVTCLNYTLLPGDIVCLLSPRPIDFSTQVKSTLTNSVEINFTLKTFVFV
uniref:Ribosomal protein S4 n=1 Tax=Thraustochytrium aureum TaxID=42467 RepID=Q9G4E0_9STRA|nr:ribosomal protein S4 [Thraustochytrium aureum]